MDKFHDKKCFTLPTHLSLSENVCLNDCLYLQIQWIIIIYYVLIEQLWRFFERASPTNPCHNLCWPALSLCSYNFSLIFAMQIHHGSTQIYNNGFLLALSKILVQQQRIRIRSRTFLPRRQRDKLGVAGASPQIVICLALLFEFWLRILM